MANIVGAKGQVVIVKESVIALVLSQGGWRFSA